MSETILHDAETVLIPVSGGRYWAKVDALDFGLVSQHSWSLARSGNRRTLYAQHRVGKTTQSMHSLITGLAKVDHVNHDGLDNRRANLRDGANCGNERNMRKALATKTSQYKGVSWRRPDRHHGPGWEATIRIGGRSKYLGKFESEVEAAHVYDRAALTAYGEYAAINFPAKAVA